MDVDLPFGLFVQEDLRCTPLDDARSRVDYRCDFGFAKGRLGTLMRGLLNRRLDAGPVVLLSRLKRAAERRLEELKSGGGQGKETSHDRSISRTSG
jgi:hypothetical protein